MSTFTGSTFQRTWAISCFNFRIAYIDNSGLWLYGRSYYGAVRLGLNKEPSPYSESFKDVTSRTILMRALHAYGHFYVLIAYESTRPKLTSDFPFLNWFTQSFLPAEPAPMWVQIPRRRR